MIFSFISALFSCRTDSPVIIPTPALPAVVYFHKDIVPIFHSNCALAGCHNGSNVNIRLNLQDTVAYNQLFLHHEIDTITPIQSFLYQQMTSGATPMPPSGKLSDYDIALVLKWITQKAKNN